MLISFKELRKIISEAIDDSSVSPVWIRPSLVDEKEELERTAEEENLSLDLLFDSFEDADLELLDDQSWNLMQNTDSSQPMTVEDARQLAGEYDRNVDSIITGMQNGTKMPAPIVLVLPDNSLYCVAGNTRLMVSRALGIRPKVLMLRINYENS